VTFYVRQALPWNPRGKTPALGKRERGTRNWKKTSRDWG